MTTDATPRFLKLRQWMKDNSVTNRFVASILGVSESAVPKILKRDTMHKSEYDALAQELAEIARESENMVIVVVSCDREKGFQTVAKTYGNPSLFSAYVAFDTLADVRNAIVSSRKKDVLQ